MRIRRLPRLLSLTSAEWRELGLACAWQLRLRVLLLRRPGALPRLAAVAARRRRTAASPLSPSDVERLARWSGVICRGSCLTDAFVFEMLASRHNLQRPVTVGVSRDRDGLRAHAWAGDDDGSRPFVAVWTDARGTRR